MAYDIIEVDVTLSASAYATGDVFFQLTEVPLPARACKLVNAFFTVQADASTLGESINCLFFKSNAGGELGILNGNATISVANFGLNKYIGEVQLSVETDPDRVDNVAIYVMSQMNATNSDPTFPSAGPHVLKGDVDYPGATQHGVYASAVVTNATPDIGSTSGKLILHVEY